MAAVIALSIAMAVAGFFLLPDMIVVQMSASGAAGNSMPKLLGLLIPLALGVIFPILFYRSGKPQHLIVAAAGILAGVLLFVFNL